MRSRYFLLFFIFIFVSGCTEIELASHVAKKMPDGQSEGKFKVGSPYKVGGKLYTPRETYNFTETGIASWYGPQFHGKPTANGERFDRNELTAAHRTLQLPSIVRVTNLENGRSLIVRVNDRGPFKRGRIIDLSEKAATLLGFKNNGTAKVKIQVLTEESRTIAMAARRGENTKGVEVAMNERRAAPRREQPAAATYQTASADASVRPVQRERLGPAQIPGHVEDGRFLPDPVVSQLPVRPTSIFVQAGSFGSQDNALRLAGTLERFGRPKVYPAIVNGQQFYRVRIGPMADVSRADGVLSQMVAAGHSEAILVVE